LRLAEGSSRDRLLGFETSELARPVWDFIPLQTGGVAPQAAVRDAFENLTLMKLNSP